MNLWDVLILLAVAAAAFAALRRICRQKKTGKNCSENCGGCSLRGVSCPGSRENRL